MIALYLQPPQHAAVFCLGEKTAIQALNRLDAVLPLSPGRAERHGFEYYRHGTLSLYAALNTRTGEVIGQTAARHTSAEFVSFPSGVVCTMPEARRFLEMLQTTGAIVRAEMEKGKDLARLEAEDALAAYASFESSYVKRNDWLESWYAAYNAPRSIKPKPYAPVLQALRDGGAQAAMEVYSRLKRTHADEYWFEDMALMYMGRRLARLQRRADAVVFLERCIAEFPGSEGAAVSHNVLATVFEQLGDLAKAAEHARAYLQKHP